MSGPHPAPHDAAPPACWRTIGVSGDRSCPELERFIHCRNCPVLAEAARAFFDRPAPEGYLESWKEVLEQPEKETGSATASVLVFRIGSEWLALPATVLAEVAPTRRVHRLPHLRGGVLTGLVNIRGQLQLCVSLAALLGFDRHSVQPQPGPDARLLLVDHDGDRWVFDVDEVAGVHRVPRSELRAVPATVSAAAQQACASLFAAHGRTVGLLDEVRLLAALHHRILE
jgi:chemotaxis-related protein WspD